MTRPINPRPAGTPEKPSERSREVYRFEVKAESNKPVKLQVVEEQKRVDEIALISSDDDTVRLFLRSASSSPAAKKALEEILKLRDQLAGTQRDIGREEHGTDAEGIGLDYS